MKKRKFNVVIPVTFVVELEDETPETMPKLVKSLAECPYAMGYAGVSGLISIHRQNVKHFDVLKSIKKALRKPVKGGPSHD